MWKYGLLLAFAVAMLPGCGVIRPAATGEAPLVATARQGHRPPDYKWQADKRVAAMLKDPESRRVDVTSNPYGGLVCGRVNAKNSLGGYVGFQPFYVVFDAAGSVSDSFTISEADASRLWQFLPPAQVTLLSACRYQ